MASEITSQMQAVKIDSKSTSTPPNAPEYKKPPRDTRPQTEVKGYCRPVGIVDSSDKLNRMLRELKVSSSKISTSPVNC
jgi:hypothetical protein